MSDKRDLSKELYEKITEIEYMLNDVKSDREYNYLMGYKSTLKHIKNNLEQYGYEGIRSFIDTHCILDEDIKGVYFLPYTFWDKKLNKRLEELETLEKSEE